MKRRRAIVGLVVLMLVGVVAGAILWPHGPRPCRATFAQVREGMTYDEVCAAVGGPPGDYTGGTRAGPDLGWSTFAIDDRTSFWTCEDGELVAYFGENGRLLGKEISTVYPATPPPFWSRLFTRLGL
jgi:hypothetical protein